jgi:hypothetical protein
MIQGVGVGDMVTILASEPAENAGAAASEGSVTSSGKTAGTAVKEHGFRPCRKMPGQPYQRAASAARQTQQFRASAPVCPFESPAVHTRQETDESEAVLFDGSLNIFPRPVNPPSLTVVPIVSLQISLAGRSWGNSRCIFECARKRAGSQILLSIGCRSGSTSAKRLTLVRRLRLKVNTVQLRGDEPQSSTFLLASAKGIF